MDNSNLYLPDPAVKHIPKWFSRMERFISGDKKYSLSGPREMNTTVKWCMPFLDCLSIGYLIILETDIFVKKNNSSGVREFVWNIGSQELISQHLNDQISDEQVPEQYDRTLYKFSNNWSIKTPSGYSTLFTHPLNRTDLPFYTMSGLVDTDSYYVPVNFPFLLKKDFEGIIEAGTPIAQLIPIKRESWSSVKEPYDEKFSSSHNYKFLHKIYRSYKRQFWHKKEYR